MGNNDTAKQKLTNVLAKIDGAYAPASLRAFKSDFEKFIEYCNHKKQEALPAEPSLIAAFIDDLENRKLSSSYIRRIKASISTIHKLNRFNDPTQDPDVKIAMRRMHRNIGRYQQQAEAININTVIRMMNVTDNSLHGIRDCMILSLAYDTLCRRSELISINIEDIHFITDNIKENQNKIFLRRSKTDQERNGRWLCVKKETAYLIINWLERTNLKNGKLLRGIRLGNTLTASLNPGQINRIYKRLALHANINERVIKHISGHSIRVGATQDLASKGLSLPQIMAKGFWKKQDTAMRYIENLNRIIIEKI